MTWISHFRYLVGPVWFAAHTSNSCVSAQHVTDHNKQTNSCRAFKMVKPALYSSSRTTIRSLFPAQDTSVAFFKHLRPEWPDAVTQGTVKIPTKQSLQMDVKILQCKSFSAISDIYSPHDDRCGKHFLGTCFGLSLIFFHLFTNINIQFIFIDFNCKMKWYLIYVTFIP